MSPGSETSTEEKIVSWLRCPDSHGALSVSNGAITCAASGFKGSVRDDVAVMLPETSGSFFDDKFHVMVHGKENQGEWDICYARQTDFIMRSLKAGMRVVDIGCGPVLPYEKPDGVSIVGLEPSFHSIRVNRQVDLRVFGTAYSMPFADASIDAIICLYAVHHMVGQTVAEGISNVKRAFSEFGRVLKPGGMLLVFEMTPVPAFGIAQGLLWNGVKRLIRDKLDMRFYGERELRDIGSATFPRGASFETMAFETSPFTRFAPIFSLPKFRVPRFVYPLGSYLYKWQMPR